MLKNTPTLAIGGFDAAEKCYNAKEYQNAWALAKKSTERNLQVVEGFSTE